jgi:AAHS family 4-hydroxybenzoate transporter-like MFS transporter
VVIVSLLAMGGFSLLAAHTSSLTELGLMRFGVGLGLGGAIPTVIALTAEYAPARLRSTLVTSMFMGFPLGAVLGGALAARLLVVFGWPSVFAAGAVLPLALAPLVAVALPESVRFLIGAGAPTHRIQGLLRRIDPSARLVEGVTVVQGEAGPGRSAIRELFAHGRAAVTLALWAVFFCNLLVMYLLINWLPALLSQAGLPIGKAILGSVLLNLGGTVGGFLIARRMDARGGVRPFLLAYLGAALLVPLTGYLAFDARLLLALVFAVGFCLIGAQFGMNALAAGYYPTAIRSTGVGWALGVGRIGSILGPMAGGAVIAQGGDARAVLLAAAAPTLVCLIGILLLSRLASGRPNAPVATLVKS